MQLHDLLPGFDALPVAVKDAIYERMWQVLSGRVKEQKYARLISASAERSSDSADPERLPGYF
jgi:hypothetical protein